MEQAWLYTFVSVFIVSLISFVGVLTISMKAKELKKIIIFLVSFAAGALFGDAFLHLLPETVEEVGFTLELAFAILGGIVLFFILEKVVYWRHCHSVADCKHHPFAYMSLVGDALHNILDGLIIGAAYLISIPAGIATTFAVAFHEIPQEIGDFAILLHGGFSKGKALFFNFLIACTAFLGAGAALLISTQIENSVHLLVGFAAGGFIYIAGSDLIPELHKETKPTNSIMQLLSFILGILVMVALLYLEVGH